MLAAANAVSCVPLRPSPESASIAAGSWAALSPSKPGSVPPPLLNELSSAVATALSFPVSPGVFAIPEFRFSSTSVEV
jgi:hypothetical protein